MNSAKYQGVGDRYVADFATGILHKFEITNEEPGIYIAYEINAETDHIDAFNRAKAIWDVNGHSLSYAKQASVSTSLGDLTAFDAVDPGIGRNAAINYVSDWSNWGLWDTIAAEYQAYATGFLGFRTGQPIVITITVVFTDQSTIDLQFSFTDNTWTYVENSAVDSRGNPIPQSADDIVRTPNGSQTYNYSGPGNPDDLANTLARFAAFGVPMSGSGYAIACTKIGNVTHCEIVPY